MRAIIFILHLILAYMLLSGWPESFAGWMRAGLALIVVMLALPISDATRSVGRLKLQSVREFKWLDYLTVGVVIFGVELLLLALFTLGPETAEEVRDDVKYWLVNDRFLRSLETSRHHRPSPHVPIVRQAHGARRPLVKGFQSYLSGRQ